MSLSLGRNRRQLEPIAQCDCDDGYLPQFRVPYKDAPIVFICLLFVCLHGGKGGVITITDSNHRISVEGPVRLCQPS